MPDPIDVAIYNSIMAERKEKQKYERFSALIQTPIHRFKREIYDLHKDDPLRKALEQDSFIS